MHVADTHYEGLERRHGYNLPCLDEVLKRFSSTAYLDIELKVPGNEEEICLAIHAHPPQRGFVVSSFLPSLLLRFHEVHSSLPLGYVCRHPEEAPLWAELPIRSFIPHHTLVSPTLVNAVHERGMQLITWTVNKPADMLRLAEWGVDGIISDDPRLLSETLAEVKAAGNS